MNVHVTKNKIRTFAASAVVLGSVLLTPTISGPDYQPELTPQRVMPTAERDAKEAAALAVFARAHHLTGLSPASLAPVSLGCRGLSDGRPPQKSLRLSADEVPSIAGRRTRTPHPDRR
jgi:hypothetical protein